MIFSRSIVSSRSTALSVGHKPHGRQMNNNTNTRRQSTSGRCWCRPWTVPSGDTQSSAYNDSRRDKSTAAKEESISGLADWQCATVVLARQWPTQEIHDDTVSLRSRHIAAVLCSFFKFQVFQVY